jgi:hypothetical protein
MRALNEKPELRYRTVMEFKSDVRTVCDGSRSTTLAHASLKQDNPWRRRMVWLTTVGLALMVVWGIALVMARGTSSSVAPTAVVYSVAVAKRNSFDGEALASAMKKLELTWDEMLDAQKEQVLEEAIPGGVDPQRKQARTQRIQALKARAAELRREVESLCSSQPPTSEK